MSKVKVKAKTSNCVTLQDGTKVYQPGRNLLDDLYSSYAEYLETGNITNDSHLGKMLLSEFKQVNKRVSEDKLSALCVMRDMAKIAKETDDYYNSKSEADKELSEYLLDKGLFPWQKEVSLCPEKNIILLAGRRAGKTYALAKIGVKHCITGYDIINNRGISLKKPRSVIILGLTITRAADLYWENVKEAAKESRLAIKHIDNSNYKIDFANGSSIELGGVSTKADINKLRGGDYSMSIIDECQSVKNLLDLVVNVLTPIQTGRDGTILMAGTGALYAGSFWEMCINDTDKYKLFHATLKDNPSIPNHEEALQKVLEDNHWTEDNVTYRREYLGECVFDSEVIVFPYRTYFDKDDKLQGFTHCTIGADWGYSDYSAYAAVLYNDYGEMRVVREFKVKGCDVTTLVDSAKEIVDAIHKEYNIPMGNIKMVADSSNGNVNQELYNRGLTFLENAYKVNKQYQIVVLKEAFNTEKLKLIKDGEIDLECDKTVWKVNPENNQIIYEIDDSVFHPDILDATRYAVNQVMIDLNLSNPTE